MGYNHTAYAVSSVTVHTNWFPVYVSPYRLYRECWSSPYSSRTCYCMLCCYSVQIEHDSSSPLLIIELRYVDQRRACQWIELGPRVLVRVDSYHATGRPFLILWTNGRKGNPRWAYTRYHPGQKYRDREAINTLFVIIVHTSRVVCITVHVSGL